MKRISIGVVLLLLIAAGVTAWRLRPRSQSFYTDADTIKQPIETVHPRDILWRPPVKLPDLFSAEGEVGEPHLSADGVTLFFVRGRPGKNADIFTCSKTPDGWSTPERIAEINSEFDDLGPELSPDGRSLYFYSDRTGGAGGYDIWIAHRGDTGWGVPRNLGTDVNSEFDEYGPGLAPDGRTLYFSSDRPKPDAAPSSVQDMPPPGSGGEGLRRDYDLYFAAVTPNGFGEAAPIRALNTSADEGAPSISPVGDFLYFCSDRPGGEGGFDIYRARSVRGEFQQPDNLGKPVNTGANELDPAVTLGGYGIHFGSNRSASTPAQGESKGYDLYYTSSREVFSEAEHYRAKIDWAALWSQIGPNLLWALLALLLLVLLFALMRDSKDGKLALFTKCLLASLTAHLVLMLLLNFWKVTVGLADALASRDPIQVALASPAQADIAEQINGSLTGAIDVDTASIPVEQNVEPIEAEPIDSAVTMAVDRTSPSRPDRMNTDEMVNEAERPAPESVELEPKPMSVADATPVEVDLPDDSGRAEATRENVVEIAHAPPPSTDVDRPRPDIRAEDSPNSAMAALSVQPHAAEAPESIASNQDADDAEQPETDAPRPEAISVESAVALDFDSPMESAPVAADETDAEQVASRLAPVEVTRTESRIPTTQPVVQVAALDTRPTDFDAIDKAIRPAEFEAAAEASGAVVAGPSLAGSSEPLEDVRSLEIVDIANPRDAGNPPSESGEVSPRVAFHESAVARAENSPGPTHDVTNPTLQRLEPSTDGGPTSDSPFAMSEVEVPEWEPEGMRAAGPTGSPAVDLAQTSLAEIELPAPSDTRQQASSDPRVVVSHQVAPLNRRKATVGGASRGKPNDAAALVALSPVESGGAADDAKPFDVGVITADAAPPRRQPGQDASIEIDAAPSSEIPLALDVPAESGQSSPAEPSGQTLRARSSARPTPRTQPPSVSAGPQTDHGEIYAVRSERHTPSVGGMQQCSALEVPADSPAGVAPAAAADSNMQPALPALPEMALNLPGETGIPPTTEQSLARSTSPRESNSPLRKFASFTAPGSDPMTLADLGAQRHRESPGANKSATEPWQLPADSSPGELPGEPIAESVATADWDPVKLVVPVPKELAAPASDYALRSPEKRLPLVERMGGSEATERSVNLALAWLAAHQSRQGRWDADGFDSRCGQCGGETDIEADRALTGLALLCFLGADHSHVKPGPYCDNVQRALNWLVGRQRRNGDMRGDETMYSHGIATIALSEAYGMSGDKSLAQPVEKAIAFIVNARNKRLGGWRYDPGQVGDTSVLGWQIMALKSARMAGIDVPEAAFESGRQWLTHVEADGRPGRYEYRPGRRYSESMTAEGMFAQQLLGMPRDDARMHGSAEFIGEHPPDWDKGANTYYWYYATLALYQHQGEVWKQWNKTLTRELLDNQRTDGRAAGSWDPVDRWSKTGGRIYQTALCALMLEVYYRYLPLYNLREVQ